MACKVLFFSLRKRKKSHRAKSGEYGRQMVKDNLKQIMGSGVNRSL
jgi:hypothetical protein